MQLKAGLGLLQLLESLEKLDRVPAELGHWTTLLARVSESLIDRPGRRIHVSLKRGPTNSVSS